VPRLAGPRTSRGSGRLGGCGLCLDCMEGCEDWKKGWEGWVGWRKGWVLWEGLEVRAKG